MDRRHCLRGLHNFYLLAMRHFGHLGHNYAGCTNDDDPQYWTNSSLQSAHHGINPHAGYYIILVMGQGMEPLSLLVKKLKEAAGEESNPFPSSLFGGFR